ncbi:MAG TPA: hypothetical protein VF170_01260 [Planctomycetaceae bacterium]
MSVFHAEAIERAQQYANRKGRTLRDQLGAGYDGIVFATNYQTAIKALRHRELYERERNVYWRLRNYEVDQVLGFAVPRLVAWDDKLWVIELEIVSPPFVLDFAGAALDEPPQWPAEKRAEWEAEKMEQFEDKWPTVRQLIAAFRCWGIYLADVKPGNVAFPDES